MDIRKGDTVSRQGVLFKVKDKVYDNNDEEFYIVAEKGSVYHRIVNLHVFMSEFVLIKHSVLRKIFRLGID